MEGTCRFRELKEFLGVEEKGVSKLKALVKNQTLPHISSMLSCGGKDVISAFNKLYNMLFDEDGTNKEFLNDFIGNWMPLSNVSSMLNVAGDKVPEVLEVLCKELKLNKSIHWENTTYLQFFTEKKIMSNVSSMLYGAGTNDPEALAELVTIL